MTSLVREIRSETLVNENGKARLGLGDSLSI